MTKRNARAIFLAMTSGSLTGATAFSLWWHYFITR